MKFSFAFRNPSDIYTKQIAIVIISTICLVY